MEPHLAWEQIIFFIFEEGETLDRKCYIIDCVDILEPDNIYFDVKQFKKRFSDTICFDQGDNLHHIKTLQDLRCVKYDSHTKIESHTLIPQQLLEKYQEKYAQVTRVCECYSKKYKIFIPVALLDVILKYSNNLNFIKK